MKRFWKKVTALALAGVMTVGMSVTVFGEETNSNLNTSRTASDTFTINLIKDYIVGSNNQTARSTTIPNGKIPTQSPKEDFKFTITRYGLWNVGQDGQGQDKYTKDNMPLFNNGASEGSETNIFTITANDGEAESADKSYVAINVPEYEAVGDYWYQVVETDNNVAGVLYGTNDAQVENSALDNGSHNRIYYIHVQVTNANTKGSYIRTVTLHKTAPDLSTVTTNAAYESWYTDNNQNSEGTTDKKVNDIQNKYYAGQLNITKTVTGNAGDKNELFKVTVVFKNESGGCMNSDITYKNFYDENGNLTSDATSLSWNDTVTVTNGQTSHTNETFTKDFYVKDGTTVTFDNIPYGVTYTITETQPSDDKYTHTFTHTNPDHASTFNGLNTAADAVTSEDSTDSTKTDAEKWSAATATGSISDDSDTVTIENNKVSVIDIGVITTNAPYIAMLILTAAALFLFVHRRKNMIEE